MNKLTKKQRDVIKFTFAHGSPKFLKQTCLLEFDEGDITIFRSGIYPWVATLETPPVNANISDSQFGDGLFIYHDTLPSLIESIKANWKEIVDLI